MADVKVRETAVNARENPLLERGDIYFLYRPRVGHDERAQGCRALLHLVEALAPAALSPYHSRPQEAPGSGAT